jgi:hypothetical protein
MMEEIGVSARLHEVIILPGLYSCHHLGNYCYKGRGSWSQCREPQGENLYVTLEDTAGQKNEM